MVGIPGQQLPPVGLVQHDAASRYIPVHLFDPAQEVVPGPDFILADDLSERFCRRLSLHMGQQKGAENLSIDVFISKSIYHDTGQIYAFIW